MDVPAATGVDIKCRVDLREHHRELLRARTQALAPGRRVRSTASFIQRGGRRLQARQQLFAQCMKLLECRKRIKRLHRVTGILSWEYCT